MLKYYDKDLYVEVMMALESISPSSMKSLTWTLSSDVALLPTWNKRFQTLSISCQVVFFSTLGYIPTSLF